MSDRLTTRNEHGDVMLCDRLQGIGICLNDDVERVAQYEDELEARRWISVEERLPEHKQKVLCFCQAGIWDILIWDYVEWAWIKDSKHAYMQGFVTHWMPMPEPPGN